MLHFRNLAPRWPGYRDVISGNAPRAGPSKHRASAVSGSCCRDSSCRRSPRDLRHHRRAEGFRAGFRQRPRRLGLIPVGRPAEGGDDSGRKIRIGADRFIRGGRRLDRDREKRRGGRAASCVQRDGRHRARGRRVPCRRYWVSSARKSSSPRRQSASDVPYPCSRHSPNADRPIDDAGLGISGCRSGPETSWHSARARQAGRRTACRVASGVSSPIAACSAVKLTGVALRRFYIRQLAAEFAPALCRRQRIELSEHGIGRRRGHDLGGALVDVGEQGRGLCRRRAGGLMIRPLGLRTISPTTWS